MRLFRIGQRWVSLDGKRYGEVVQMADFGLKATIVVTDGDGNLVTRAEVDTQFQMHARLAS